MQFGMSVMKQQTKHFAMIWFKWHDFHDGICVLYIQEEFVFCKGKRCWQCYSSIYNANQVNELMASTTEGNQK